MICSGSNSISQHLSDIDLAARCDQPLPGTEIANFPKNEHWRGCTLEDSTPCEVILPVFEYAHYRRRAQWIDATLACSLAAGVLKPKVSLGR